MRIKQDRQPEDTGTYTPVHQASRRAWNEQIAMAYADRDSWRLAAIGAIAVAIISVGGVVYFGSENHIVPFIVHEDAMDNEIAIARANVAAPANIGTIRHFLYNWISEARSVTPDVIAERKNITDVYNKIDQGSPAYIYLNNWYTNNSPFKRAAKMTVSVSRVTVLPESGKTWQVQWIENYQARNGDILPSKPFQANIKITIDPPRTDKEIIRNPAGIFVHWIAWQELPTS
jgi:type IV secretory pathway TrbF-like protein